MLYSPIREMDFHNQSNEYSLESEREVAGILLGREDHHDHSLYSFEDLPTHTQLVG